jgi:hypothetical protein
VFFLRDLSINCFKFHNRAVAYNGAITSAGVEEMKSLIKNRIHVQK